jgi:hypothetical protein
VREYGRPGASLGCDESAGSTGASAATSLKDVAALACRAEVSMGFDWYHRPSLDPCHMSACEPHGAELVALGFCRGVSLLHAAKLIDVAEKCMLCDGSVSIAEVRSCRCNTLGVTCPVHFDPRLAEVAMRRAWSNASCSDQDIGNTSEAC